jgi:YggT family protein
MSIIIFALNIFSFILLARVLVSWFPNIDPYNPIIRFLFQVTEPVLRPVRQLLPQGYGMDFSPIVVFLVINVLTVLLARF